MLVGQPSLSGKNNFIPLGLAVVVEAAASTKG